MSVGLWWSKDTNLKISTTGPCQIYGFFDLPIAQELDPEVPVSNVKADILYDIHKGDMLDESVT